MKQALTDLLEFIVHPMVVHQEQCEVFVYILRVLLAVYHSVAEIGVDLLGEDIDELSLPLLLFTLMDEEHL